MSCLIFTEGNVVVVVLGAIVVVVAAAIFMTADVIINVEDADESNAVGVT